MASPPLARPGRGRAAVARSAGGQPGVELFLARAREVQPDFALTPYLAPDVAEIIRRLDGIPLAIELAARARRRPHSGRDRAAPRRPLRPPGYPAPPGGSAAPLASIGARPQPRAPRAKRSGPYSGGSRSSPGPFAAEAAGAVCSSPHLPSERVRQLLDRTGREVARDARRERSRRHASVPAARDDPHLRERAARDARASSRGCGRPTPRYYLALAEKAEPELTGREQERFFERLEHEHANLRAALEFSLAEGRDEWALRLSAALTLFWRVRGHFERGPGTAGRRARLEQRRPAWPEGEGAVGRGLPDAYGRGSLRQRRSRSSRASPDSRRSATRPVRRAHCCCSETRVSSRATAVRSSCSGEA